MAQSGYTPILIYASGTTGNTPSASNLTSSSTGAELALNYYDGKLFYKDASGNVQLLASKATSVNVASLSFGTTGLTPNTATTGAITVAGTLITSNGGTGLSSYTAGDLPYYASGTALSKLAIGTANYILSSSGTAPQWVNSINIGSGTFTSVTDSGLTSGRVTYAGTSGLLQDSANLTFNGTTLTANTLNLTNALGVAYGGTGLTSLTSGYIPYGNGTSAFSSSSSLYFDGANLGVGTSSPTNRLGVVGGIQVTQGSAAFPTTGSGIEIVAGVVGGVNFIQAYNRTGASWQNLEIDSAQTVFGTNGSERMRLTSAGYLGIGTSSPATQLQITGSFSLGNGQNIGWGGAYGAGVPTIAGSSGSGILFYANGSTSGLTTTFDASGNLGLGVTPSAWTSAFKVVEIGSKGGALAGASGEVDLFNNAYNNGSNYIYGISSYATQFQMNNLGQFRWYTAPSGTAGTTATFTQAMTLSNAGGLSVGTTSDAGAGNIRASGVFYAGDGSTSNNAFARAGGSGTGIYFPAANTIGFSTSASEVARIDSSGNLGLGVTPSAWGGNYKVMEYAGGAVSTYGNSQFSVWQNAYDSGAGAYKYVNTAAASRYLQTGGVHYWYNAPSGTAGGTISFTQAMTLDNSGNLGIGTNSPSTYGNLAVVSSSGTLISVKGGSSANQGGNFVVVKAGSNGSLALFGDSANQLGGTPDAAVGIYTASSVPLLFNVAGSEKARIDSSGNLLVGTTGTSGSSSNTALTASGLFRSYTASVNAATATATTITTLTTGINACYLVNINVNGVTNDATDYSAYATIITNGTTARIANSSNGTLCLITLSGLNVQVTQSSGSTQTCYATLTRVA